MKYGYWVASSADKHRDTSEVRVGLLFYGNLILPTGNSPSVGVRVDLTARDYVHLLDSEQYPFIVHKLAVETQRAFFAGQWAARHRSRHEIFPLAAEAAAVMPLTLTHKKSPLLFGGRAQNFGPDVFNMR